MTEITITTISLSERDLKEAICMWLNTGRDCVKKGVIEPKSITWSYCKDGSLFGAEIKQELK